MPESKYTHILYGDLSGIQDFVFRVKSERAAKTLKARSWFVQALMSFAQRLAQDTFPNSELLYNGGGSFYLLLEKSDDFETKMTDLRLNINRNLWREDIQLTLVVLQFESDELETQFSLIWREIQRESSIAKMKQFANFFEPFEKTFKPNEAAPKEWVRLLDNLLKTDEPFVVPGELEYFTDLKNNVGAQGMRWFNYDFRLDDKVGKKDKKKNNRLGLPVWTTELIKNWKKELDEEFEADADPEKRPKKPGDLIEFEWLARFAARRTGTDKIGILKMDVDGLGDAFKKFNSKTALQKFSAQLKSFFEEKLVVEFVGKGSFDSLKILVDGSSVKPKMPFFENIYVIYSGGDDTFLLGAWDAVFEFAIQFHQKWEDFVQTELPQNQKGLTISAALLMVDPHFPVVRFAELADTTLEKAKSFESKNHICVFGENQPMQWDDFKEAHQKAHFLRDLILFDNEPRAVLERFKRATGRFRSAMQRVYKGSAEMLPVWNLLYAIRESKHRSELESELVDIYSADVLQSLRDKRKHRETIPVAVRWAEFLTRIESSNNRSENG